MQLIVSSRPGIGPSPHTAESWSSMSLLGVMEVRCSIGQPRITGSLSTDVQLRAFSHRVLISSTVVKVIKDTWHTGTRMPGNNS